MDEEKGVAIDSLPRELLERIFSYLELYDLQTCKNVSDAWQSIAEAVNEKKWRDLCKEAFGTVYIDAYRKAELSYEYLYKSLKSWSDITYSKVEVHGIVNLEDIDPKLRQIRYEKKLSFLKNGIFSYPIFSGQHQADKKNPLKYDNSVVYFYSKTLEKVDAVMYDFNFSFYEETDDFAVFRSDLGELRILTKVDKKVHTLEKMTKVEGFLKFYIVGNKVFFINNKMKLCVVTCTSAEGLGMLSKEELLECDKSSPIVAINIHDKKIKVMSQRGIYEIKDQEMKLLQNITLRFDNTTTEATNSMKDHGFDWSNQDIYNEYEAEIQLAKIKRATVLSYNGIVFIGTAHRYLNIYTNAYRRGELTCLWSKKPTLKVDLNDYFNINFKKENIIPARRRINQIGVIEIEGGHRLVLLYCHKLVTVVLYDDIEKKRIKKYIKLKIKRRLGVDVYADVSNFSSDSEFDEEFADCM